MEEREEHRRRRARIRCWLQTWWDDFKKNLGKRIVKYWNWFGAGIFLHFLWQFLQDYIWREQWPRLINVILNVSLPLLRKLACLIFITGVFKLLWEREPPPDPRSYLPPERRQILLKEYEELNQTVRNRGLQFATVQSILITGSLIATTTALTRMEKPFREMTIMASMILVVLAFVIDLTTTKVDRIHLDRVKEIERILGMDGHHKLYESKIKHSWWYQIRKKTWPAIFLTLIIFYAILLWQIVFDVFPY